MNLASVHVGKEMRIKMNGMKNNGMKINSADL